MGRIMSMKGGCGTLGVSVLAMVVAVGSAQAYEEVTVTEGGTLSGTVTLVGQVPKPKGYNLVTFPDPVYCGRISNGTGWRLLQAFNVGVENAFRDVVVLIEGIERGKPDGEQGLGLGSCLVSDEPGRLAPHVLPVPPDEHELGHRRVLERHSQDEHDELGASCRHVDRDFPPDVSQEHLLEGQVVVLREAPAGDDSVVRVDVHERARRAVERVVVLDRRERRRTVLHSGTEPEVLQDPSIGRCVLPAHEEVEIRLAVERLGERPVALPVAVPDAGLVEPLEEGRDGREH